MSVRVLIATTLNGKKNKDRVDSPALCRVRKFTDDRFDQTFRAPATTEHRYLARTVLFGCCLGLIIKLDRRFFSTMITGLAPYLNLDEVSRERMPD
jgi:hypothetical protein